MSQNKKCNKIRNVTKYEMSGNIKKEVTNNKFSQSITLLQQKKFQILETTESLDVCGWYH